MNHDKAEEFEQQGRLVEAADLYETIVEGNSPPLESIVNLAILYWQVTDYGYWSTMNLPKAFVARAGERFPQILARGRDLYPHSTEIEFWRRYIDWADLGEPLSIDDCKSLLSADSLTLVPALYLFTQETGNEFLTEATALLRLAKAKKTIRNQYIESVIESTLGRRSQ